MKRCSISLIIRETQIKATMMYSLTLFRMTIIRKSTNNKCWRGCEEKRTHLTLLCACMLAKLLQSCKILCDPMDCTHQAPLPMGSSRQEYSTGLPCPSPGDLFDPGFEPISLTSPPQAVGCYVLLQGIFPTQGSNPHLLHFLH